MPKKPRLAVYWAASCGGCEIALVNLHERLLIVDSAFDFVFCPCLLDTKTRDVEAMDDASIAVTLFNGAIRTTENVETARLMRRKSALLVAFGSCACEGCVPGLANLSSRDALLDTVYGVPDGGIVPRSTVEVPEGTLHLPSLLDRVHTLADVVEVDYSIPGCPPEPHQIWNVIELLISGQPLPPRGSVLGAGVSTVCKECARARTDKKISRLYRTWEIIPDPTECLLEQGLVCMGVVTRDGCGAPCPRVNMPCTGCYGAPDGVFDQGGKMVSALGSMIDVESLKSLPENDIADAVDRCLDGCPDLAGTVYRYSLAGGALRNVKEP